MGMGKSVCIHTILYAVQLVPVQLVPTSACGQWLHVAVHCSFWSIVEMDITLLTSC